MEEQARLLGMSAERECKLLAQIEALKRELDQMREQRDYLMRKIKNMEDDSPAPLTILRRLKADIEAYQGKSP
jgi:cell division protein FtsB